MSASRTIKRNDPCPCGSGQKYKKCCLSKEGGPVAAGVTDTTSTDSAGLLRQATALHRNGELDAAVGMYRQVLAREPRHAAALYYLGQVMGQLGKPEQGIRLLRQSLAVDADRARTHRNLAALLLEIGDANASLASARRAVELDPDDYLAQSTAASCLARLNRVEEASAAAEKAVAIRPDDLHCQLLLANVARKRGDFDEARRILDEILATPDIDAGLRCGALSQRGQVLDRLGFYDEAFAAFKKCGVLTASRETRRFDMSFWPRRIAGHRTEMTADLLERFRDETYDDDHPVPVFMVGFPRSGTTMTEQILAAHPQVVTSDERPFMQAINDAIVEMFGTPDDVPGQIRNLDREKIAILRDTYWAAVRDSRKDVCSGRIFVDKLPLNIVDIGLLSIVFPEAKAIVALRDPRDCCLSCFMQDFTLNAAMVNFLSVERTVAFYAEVMDLWLTLRDRLTIRFIEARYEDTVRDLPKHARRLLAFLDLEWDDAVLRFHESAGERLISTPSFEAVTQPIHTRAIGRWRNYRKHIAPHVAPLQRFIEAFGYDA